MSTEPTLPPVGARTPRNIINYILAWSQVHTVAAAIIGGLAAGFLLGKIL